MSQVLTVELVAGVVWDVAWMSAVPLALAGLATRAIPRLSAAARHGIWAVALAALPLAAGQALGGPLRPLSWTGLVVVWGVGVAACLVPLLRGLLCLQRLTRTARRIGHTPEGTPVLRAAVSAPLTWGHLRPVILLPAVRADWSAEEESLVLAHERAHIARGDWVVHVAAQLLCALFWFQPLAWFAAGRLDSAAEDAADDGVLRQGARPSAYAAVLLRVGTGAPRASLSMARSAVGQRIERVLGRHVRHGHRRGAMALSAVVALGMLLGLGALVPEPEPPHCESPSDGVPESLARPEGVSPWSATPS